MGRHVIWVGLLMGYWYWKTHDPKWQTMIFTTLTLSQMAHVMAIRSERLSVFRIGLAANKPLLGAVALTVILQFAFVYIPFFQGIFKTFALSAADML